MSPLRPPRPPIGPFDPNDPTDPTVPIDLPPMVVPSGDEIVAGLAEDIPLLLLPVRIVTRYHRGDGPEEDPTHLLVRIYPDVVHVDGHEEALSADEVTIGQTYWRRIWLAGGDAARRQEAHSWLFGLVEPPRAVWVISQTAPTNPAAAPSEPVPEGAELPVPPKFPVPGKEQPTRTLRADLLPERWSVTLVSNNEVKGRWWSEPVRRGLVVAPSLSDLPEGGSVDDLLAIDELRWLRDFSEARDAGMAIRVPLVDETRWSQLEVIVAGASRGAGHGPAWAELLEHHRLSSGLDSVRPGTPTNTTETVAAGFSAVPADAEAFLTDQLDVAPGPSRPLTAPSLLPAMLSEPATRALDIAFGFDEPGALDRAEHRDDLAVRWAGAMNRVLWPATIGHTLRGPLRPAAGTVLDDEHMTWTRSWFRDCVRGGGPLPTLRIGDQPYGVLPVSPRPGPGRIASTNAESLEDLLWSLLPSWTNSAETVAALTPVGGEAGTPDDQAVTVAAVLGAVPHPTAFRLREAPVEREALAAGWADALAELEELMGDIANFAVTEFNDQEPDLLGATGLTGQQSALLQLGGLLEMWKKNEVSGLSEEEFQPAIDHIDQVLRPLTEAHAYRSRAREKTDAFGGATLPDENDPDLWYTVYGSDGSGPDGTYPELELIPRGDVQNVARVLRDLAEQARAAAPLIRPFVDQSIPRPLLRVLVEHALLTAPLDELDDMAIGLDDLADMLESDDVADPLDELTRLFRETIGLATHRFDAWITSLATDRLARRRDKKPTGLQIGCYGWVQGLRPDEGGPDTSGFIHAPSLDHAATAAVLRSSWLAFANDASDAAFSVDLSSDRMRRATWLLDGVRNGLDLGELLGARFERRLHDADLDDLIDDLRDAVHSAAPTAGLASSVVDGLLLATAYTEAARELGTDPVLVAVEAVRTAQSATRADELDDVLQQCVADLDAVADGLLAQSVHSLLKGNLAQSAAALAASGSGDSGVPPLTVADAHHASRTITHRIMALLPAVETDIAGSLYSLAEPSLAAWLDALVPGVAATPVRVVARGDDGTVEASVEGTLGGLGLGVVELLSLVPPGGDIVGSRLARVIVGLVRRSHPDLARHPRDRVLLDPHAPGPEGASLADLAVAAGALRSALGPARPLRAADLTSTTEPEGGPDLADLDRRRDDIIDRLRPLGSASALEELVGTDFVDLLAVDPDGVVAVLECDDPMQRSALLATVVERADDARAHLEREPEGWADMSPQAQADELAARIERAVAAPLPVLPRVRPEDHSALIDSAARSGRRLGSPLAAPAWLLEAGRVHPGAGALSQALQLVEAVTGRPRTEPTVAQLPDVEGEGWVAVERPTSDTARLSLLSFSGFEALEGDGLSGLLFDAWTETVPERGATTGVALHLDSPGSRPPQSLLLATPADRKWDSLLLVGLVREALDLVQARSVGPETLQNWGHHLPGVFLPEDAVVAVVDDIEEGP